MKRVNKSLLLGAFLGITLIGLAIAIEISGSSPAVFLHPVALLIVFGGTTATALIQLPLHELKRVFLRTYLAIKTPKENPVDVVSELITISSHLKRDMMYLDKAEAITKNTMLAESLKLISMGFRAEEIRRFLEKKKEQNSIGYMTCHGLFSALAKVGPAFGLVGTLIGLIVLLYYHMSGGEMGKVASSMGVALTATLYGVAMSNLVFGPLGEYMMYIAEQNEMLDEIIIEGALLLKERKHPLYLVQSLKWYVPREDYKEIDAIAQRELSSTKTHQKSDSRNSANENAAKTESAQSEPPQSRPGEKGGKAA